MGVCFGHGSGSGFHSNIICSIKEWDMVAALDNNRLRDNPKKRV